MKNLKNKNCLLTGAASGIGRSLAIGLAEEGMNLFLADIDSENLEKVKEEIAKTGVKVYTRICNVSKFEEINEMAKDFYQKLGDLDLLINNAGIAGGGFIEDISLDEWKRVLDINLWSIIYSIKVFLPKMLERGSGHIVNTGSGAGIVGLPYHPHYVASKFAVLGLTEALYSELYNTGIKFSVICPIRVRTNIGITSPIVFDPKLFKITDQEEIKTKLKKFQECFAIEYFKTGVEPDFAAKRYIKGIKKNRLYIFDKRILRIALLIKGIAFKRGWKAVLRKQSKKDYSAIETCLVESGLSSKEHLRKILGNRTK
ncbi:MAG: SDR family NAD(P)-dependent oxidoreductase [Promethearchaeota archaeon]